MKRLGLVLTVMFATNSFAAGQWTNALTVKDISYSSSEGRFANTQLRVTFDELPTTEICRPAEKLAIYDPVNPTPWDTRWLSILLSAQAQNKKVQIFVPSCRENTVPLIFGVKILRD